MKDMEEFKAVEGIEVEKGSVKEPTSILQNRPPLPPRPPRRPSPNNQTVENPLPSQKPKNSKKSGKKLSKKSIIIITISLLAVIIATISSMFIILYIKNGKKIVLPSSSQVEVIKNDDDIYLISPIIKNAEKYIFNITTEKENFTIESESNIVDVSGYLSQPKTFEIKFCAQKVDARSRSKYSKTLQYQNTEYLKTPNISFDSKDNSIVFSHINNADSYTVFYIKENEIKQKEFIKQGPKAKLFLDIPNGDYTVYVVAKSNSPYFKQSKMSELIQIQIINKIPSPKSAILSGNKLKVELEETCEQIVIQIADIKYFYQTNGQKSLDIDLSVFNIDFKVGTSVLISCKNNNSISKSISATFE